VTEYIVTITNGRGERHAVGRGFYGQDPERFWVALDSPDAKTWPTAEDAQRFVDRTGDRSWGLAVEARSA
jgi:hypothetical protein